MNKNKEQLARIRNKLAQLKTLDKNFSLFGAQKHQYNLRRPISREAIQRFERTHKIALPNEYVDFLTLVGNGGAGPFYGLERFEYALYGDLEFVQPETLLSPAEPFLYSEPWNLTFNPTVTVEEDEEEYKKQLQSFEKGYFDIKHLNGVIAICNFGCGASLNLVVNGQEYGNIWTDDRASDNGIYPSHEIGNKDRINFLNWYELWLDSSLEEIHGIISASEASR